MGTPSCRNESDTVPFAPVIGPDPASIFGHLPDGVVLCDEKGSITYANHAAELLLGLTECGAAGRGIVESYVTLYESGRGRCDNPCIKVLATNQPIQNKRLLICVGADSAEHLVLESAAPIQDDTGHCIGAILLLKDFSDMTDEMRIPHKMESFKTLAGGMANDFNNLLTVINNSLFMARHGQKPESELYQMLTNAEKASFQATMLTNQLLSIAGGGKPVTTEVDLKNILANVTGFVISSDTIEYTVTCDDNLSLVSADRGMIDQAIGQILINAVQALPGGGTISIQARNVLVDSTMPLPLADGPYVRVSVHDSGTGISPEDRTRVFDPFFTTKPGNHGLGLTLAYAAVRQHNGHITIDSGNNGTTVSLYLPALDRTSGEKPQKGADKGRILFMDDEELLRHSARRILGYLGFIVETVNDGDEAIAAYRTSLSGDTRFDLIILDLKVNNGRGGKEVVREILALNPDARVVISSGYINDPVVVDFKKYGFCGAITKPYNIADMNATLLELVQK